MPRLLLLLPFLWPYAAPYLDPDAIPDTDAEVERVCPALAQDEGRWDAWRAVSEQLALARARLDLDRAAEWSDPAYYRSLQRWSDYLVWLSQVYECTAKARQEGAAGPDRREALAQLRRLLGPDAYRVGRAAIPPPPPHVPQWAPPGGS